MQLNSKDAASRRRQLAAATLGLLGAAAPQAQAAGDADKTWAFDTAVLVYAEGGGRVQAIEPVLKASSSLDEDRVLSAKLVLDTLSGASPNGAAPSSKPQTFSGPSGGSSYTTPAGELPLDKSFKDTRVAGNLDYLFPLSRDGRLSLGTAGSKETDFLSVSASLGYTLDFNQKNTTLSSGLNLEFDQINPTGGAVPVPLSVMTAGGAGGGRGGERDGEGEGGIGGEGRSRNTADFLLGVTQILSSQSLMQLSYSVSASRGYHTDPYKILSVVNSSGDPLRYVYEGRPDTRKRQGLFAQYKRLMFGNDVADLSYRHTTDDWGIKSKTAELSYRWNFSEHLYLEPHLRAYRQTAASYYRVALYDGEETRVANASADPRLGAFNARTLGFKVGGALAGGNQWSLRMERYQQVGQVTGVPAAAAAGLSRFNLAPDLTATWITVGYSFK